MSRYAIEGATMTGIADAVRGLRHEKQAMTPAQIEAKIRASRLGIPIVVSNHINPETGEWERPEDWPDLDVLAAQVADDEDCVYLTYDCRKTPGYGWIGVYVANATRNTPYWVERGYTEAGVFVVDVSYELNSGDYFRRTLDDTDGDVQLWRVRSNSHITRYCHVANTTTNAQNFQNNLQPMVERAGKLPYVTDLSSSTSTNSATGIMGSVWLERDAMVPGKSGRVTTLASCWYACYSLQSLDLSGWDTTGWAVTTLAYCWYACYSLQSLDLTGWDTTGWAVTTLAYCWNGCYSLQSLDLSGWDTTGWAVTTLASCWSGCYSLQSLDLTGWDTTGWAVTTLASCWYACYSLQSLDLSGWDTTGWAVTTLTSCWQNCYSLQSLALSGWDTTGWAVTTLASCWQNCYSLQSLALSGWDTTGWAVTTLAYCWNGCYSLQSLDLSGWDTTGWAVTTLAYCWYACYSLQSLALSGWDTTGWAVTTLASCWNGCYSLQSLDLSGWDTTGWAVTTLTYCWQNCYSLQSLALSGWDTTGWAVTDTRYTFSVCQSMRSLDVPESLGVLSSATSNVAQHIPNTPNIVDFSGVRIYVNHTYAAALNLTPRSLVNIIDRLPTVTAARTIALGQTNKLKLTDAEIAVATQKGWTVA